MKLLNGIQFAEMVEMGAHHLSQNANYVDALNVFPVPDGDTGTNMNLSMTSGAKETKLNKQPHIGKTTQALSKGLLMGARGNSGVILSQLFRGFAKHIESNETIDANIFAAAMAHGVETAYKAVMKPVEGTILTVAKDSANKCVEAAKNTDDIIVLLEQTLEEAKASLKRTPDLLPVLKEVGVVDSGGQGLVFVYEGFLASLKGEQLPAKYEATMSQDFAHDEHHVQNFMDTSEIVFGYCTEFMVKFKPEKLANNPFVESEFRLALSEYGDSLLVISDDEIAKVHIHSEQPGECFNYGQKFGDLINVKVENMREQHTAIVGENNSKPAEKHPYAVMTIAMGDGIAELLRSVGANVVIEGGQTMNPSTEDIVKAIEAVGAEKVIILPNNKNIIMAAEQAAQVLNIEAVVVPTKSVPQGMAAILAFNPDRTPAENKEAMISAFANVKTGQVTHAVRNTSIDGVDIAKDDFMAIAESSIILATPSLEEAAKNLVENLVDEDAEIVTIIYGEDTTEEAAQALAEFVEQLNEDVEVEVYNGKQPLYPYIISVE